SRRFFRQPSWLLLIRSVFCLGRGKGDAVRASGLVVFVNPDDDAGVAQVLVRRNFEVVGRGLVFVHATGKVEGGAVAGAEEAAFPGRRQARAGAGFEVGGGRAAQMGADAHANEQGGLARPECVLGVFGGVAGAVGIGIGDVGVLFLDARQLFFRATHDPDRFAAPFDRAHLAGGQVGDLDFDRGPGGTRLFRWGEGANKRNGGRHTGDTAYRTGGGYPETARRIWREVGINRTVFVMHQRILTHLPILVDATALP